MVVKNAGIQFHRRSRYEDILELVNDNEEALKPFPNRDAVFYKQSNKGTRFDGKDHLDKLKVQGKQIAERIVRDHMLREYASDNNLTHRALFTEHDRPEPEQPQSPQMFNIATDPDSPSTIEEYGTPQQQLAEINETLQNISNAQQGNQQAITQAHQQQLEREEEGGSGILRSLGSGALRIGGNVAGNMASGMNFSSAMLSGMTHEAMQALQQTLMRRVVPPPRPLLDFTGEGRSNREFTTYEATPIPNMQYLQPSIILEPHQPNFGATQQPLPIASSSQPAISELPRPQRPTEPRAKNRPRPTPKTSSAPPRPNFQEGGSSGSGSNEERTPPRPSTPPPKKKGSIKRDRNILKESQDEETATTTKLIIPSKIGIQKLREVFEEANNRKTINATTYRNYKSIYNNWIRSAGDKDMKKQYLQDLKDLYRNSIYKK